MEKIKHEAIRIAKLAGNKIKDIRENGQYQETLKGGYELVTTADLISNEVIKSEILKLFPNHTIISEEDGDNERICIQNPTWIIDPIDGTVGYANDQYQVAVSIAFAVDNEVQVGVVYNPFLDELFVGMRGSGAYLNNKPIKVKNVTKLEECVIGTGFPHKKDNMQDIISRFGALLPYIRDVRRLGSPALDICWVACGRMQGFYEAKLYPWDVAAAKCIAIEAGAKTGYFHVDNNDAIPTSTSENNAVMPTSTSKNNDAMPEGINGNFVIISSPQVFEEFRNILVSV